MKRLSDFKDEAGIAVVADLLEPIFSILAKSDNKKMADKSGVAMLTGFFKNSPSDMKKVLAILSEVDPAEYHCNGITVARDLITLASDKELLSLFTSAEPATPTESLGSASENTEA
jgi:hypothetical protein